MEVVAHTKYKVDGAKPSGTEQHQGPPPKTVDGEYRNDGKHHVGDAGHDDVEQHIAYLISRRLEDFLCIIEYDIGAAPLLEDRNDYAEQQHAAERTAEKHAQTALLSIGGIGRLNRLKLTAGIL